jgi:hypothetical protein
VLSFDPDGTLRSIETEANAAWLDSLEQVEFYNGLLVPAEMMEGDSVSLETVFDRIRQNGAGGFVVGRRQGVLLIGGIDWQHMRPTPRSIVRKIL